MAMYYQSSSEIQADGLQTLFLMNPNYAGYSDPQPSMLFMNSAAAPLPQFVGIPLSHDPTRPIPPPAARLHCNTWGMSMIDQPTTQMPEMSSQQTLTPRGLSLSLSAHHQTAGDRDFPKNCSPPTDSVNMQGVMMGSKYLKAAQELLDEVVRVGNSDAKSHRPEKAKAIKDSGKEEETGNRGGGTELTTAQRQEIQMKKAKLKTMLDEVEQRCRQYNQQMQIIVGSFEQAAGVGSAKSYTQVALKTILKQFRCLKTTISAQIKGLSKSLGEEEGEGEGSRLKFVDSHQRQQRALQQLGMMQNNAWRPQRGLPERAVSVLRAWLFEHFLHPYPKDSDKQMLAKQTGLTRSQVSNWFINARVRLWKPMVEEMYIEETKNNQTQFPSTTNVEGDGDASIKPEPDNRITTAHPPPPARTNFAQLISSLNMENQLPEKSPKKARNSMEMRGGGDDHTAADNYLSANINTRFGGDLAAANSFSLSLGLPPTDHNFLSHRSFELVEGGGIDEASHPSIAYQILDFQNRKPFPPQLLPDFVA